MSQIGKEVRLAKLLNPKSKNSIVVAMDHAPVLGPLPGIVDPRETVKLIAKGNPDTFFMPCGAVKQVYPYFVENQTSFMVSIDVCVEMGPEPNYFMLSDTVMHALELGASGVSMHVLIGPEKTSDMLKGLTKVSIECDNLGMPLMAIMYPRGFKNDYAVEHVKWAARVGAELGADIVKTYYTGSKETFAEVTEACPVPVMLSGGAFAKEPSDFFMMLKNVIDGGGRGVAVGRNLWQYKEPLKMLEAIKVIVHEKGSVEQAMEELK
ncbi:MAG: fructose-bisphosphate aldolase [Chloroflexi bacterium]|jgi:fructose-bisphosphate aldolase/2-amino-3,7-dideoxy-D-threo-hept-6-ulosonate synthase|nr:fructose-bisphosphate aldolase [Chloroflexota bacterium]